jgi:hypothetical protein
LITKQDLLESIAECQGIRNPNANTCLKLAAFYTILDHMEDDSATDAASDNTESGKQNRRPLSSVSFSAPEQVVNFQGAGEFSQAVNGLPAQSAWGIMSELMSMLQMIEPKLYHAVMRKIEEVQ